MFQSRKKLNYKKTSFIIAVILSLFPILSFSLNIENGIKHDLNTKSISITSPDKNLSLLIDYKKGCVIKMLNIKGTNKLSKNGVNTGFNFKNKEFNSSSSSKDISVSKTANSIIINGIKFGEAQISVTESWTFKIEGQSIIWDINRTFDNDAVLEDTSFPQWNFADLNVWKGGILDNGGMVWSKYLKDINDTYGVHTGGVTFWNAKSGDALRISTETESNKFIASKFSQSKNQEFTYTQMVTDLPLEQRYDLSRFKARHFDVFSAFRVKKGKTNLRLKLEYVDYFKEYSRGILPGIDGVAVRELLNTTGRYGVVDNNIVGANGWLTNWKCLHEPFFAQIGMALNDPNYTKNMSSTLDQERDLAMLENGRVLSRWHDIPGDEIKDTYNSKTGYYEAKWGYTVDSQTGYIINTSEQFDLNGDIGWLKSHQKSGESALNWLIKRDSDGNGIFEMMNNNIAEKKASDWLDIVWAGYENAFVNAQMYEALTLWANCERVLGATEKSDYYLKVAEKLKNAFNKSTKEGGFWSEEKKQYIYWRDKDGSTHGDNLVTPVNFAAIAFGLCDDKAKIAQILDGIEQRTSSEKLFHWPLCFDSFKREEVSPGNWPFPKYENGDIFPTWGYLGIRAYAAYDKNIALKYINNLLEQYHKDGLSSQRYSRTTQLGLGDDILAGISTSITALYRDIYGIRPKWNRMGLEPNMNNKLNGTIFNYSLRGKDYKLKLSVGDYQMQTKTFVIKSNESFGANRNENQFVYFHGNKEEHKIKIISKAKINLEMKKWDKKELSFKANNSGPCSYQMEGLVSNANYNLSINGKIKYLNTDNLGNISFRTSSKTTENISLIKI